MSAPPLPDLADALVDADTVERLFDDLVGQRLRLGVELKPRPPLPVRPRQLQQAVALQLRLLPRCAKAHAACVREDHRPLLALKLPPNEFQVHHCAPLHAVPRRAHIAKHTPPKGQVVLRRRAEHHPGGRRLLGREEAVVQPL